MDLKHFYLSSLSSLPLFYVSFLSSCCCCVARGCFLPPDCLLPQTGPSSSCLLPAWIPLLDSQDVSQPDFPASGWYSQPHNFPHLEVPGFTPTPAIKLRNHVLWCLLCLKCFQLLSHGIESAFAGWKYMLPCLVQASGQDTGCWEEERSSHRVLGGEVLTQDTSCWEERSSRAGCLTGTDAPSTPPPLPQCIAMALVRV